MLSMAIIILFAFVQIDGQQNVTTTCGKQYKIKSLITYGSEANHFPWHAAIYHKDSTSAEDYKCGGTVIDSKSVLTAGHCVSKYNHPMDAVNIVVYLGRLNLNANENSSQSFVADKVILHPNFNVIDLNNDIAIIRFSKDATFNNYVQPICLWNENRTDLSEVIGKSGTVIGWGRTESGRISKVLREASIEVVDTLDCIKTNPALYGHFLSKSNFCAGSRNGTGVCDGDSGGSISFYENGIFFIRGIVSGIATMQNETANQFMCDSMQYAFFTDVAKYLPWINDQSTNKLDGNVMYNYEK